MFVFEGSLGYRAQTGFQRGKGGRGEREDGAELR